MYLKPVSKSISDFNLLTYFIFVFLYVSTINVSVKDKNKYIVKGDKNYWTSFTLFKVYHTYKIYTIWKDTKFYVLEKYFYLS